jgi:formate hydrogenlyase subunit 4
MATSLDLSLNSFFLHFRVKPFMTIISFWVKALAGPMWLVVQYSRISGFLVSAKVRVMCNIFVRLAVMSYFRSSSCIS